MTKLICEIGINHDGSTNTAKKLIDIAHSANSWGIKFQYRNLRSYKDLSANEIGNEIINNELSKNFLTVNTIKKLTKDARAKKLKVGCSFFSKNDSLDFKDFIFDFYKIPSVSSLDFQLIETLKKKNKLLLVSTGSLSESELNILAKKKIFNNNTVILHCISNYPLHYINAQLNIIRKLKNRFPSCSIGYSSHEEEINNCLISLGIGIDYLERHITIDKNKDGLDHTSSSDFNEIQILGKYCKNLKLILGNGFRFVNQGEKINRQNLGKSAYAKKNILNGTKLTKKKIYYKSPQIGFNEYEIQKYLDKKVHTDIKKDDVLSISTLNTFKLKKINFKKLNKTNISIPIRPHDFRNFILTFPLKNYEFHLTYKDLDINFKKFFELNSKFFYKKNFSVHAPDYINSHTILDIFSKDKLIKKKSFNVMQKTIYFAQLLSLYSSKRVNVISSFSTTHVKNKKLFYNLLSKQIKKWKILNRINVLPQWLPPLAWYFGGAVKLDYFNDPNDLDFILKNKISICLDTSHFILSCNYFNCNPFHYFNKFNSIIRHYHISDGLGIDGEGLEIGKGILKQSKILSPILKSKFPKVLEVWQGHLNNGMLFKNEMIKISKLY